jgi:NADH:ubiquinone oxidoreductase subunit F (NADH-binding)
MAQTFITLKNAGKVDPMSISDYMQQGGYRALNRALKMEPIDIIKEIKESGLRGRGGAGFPTGLKHEFTYNSEALDGKKYVVVNADEGEPGTFKDRPIMEQDPHLLIEGMTISAFAIGASMGYIYIRGEYYDSIHKLRRAIFNAYSNGFLGDNILDSGFDFHIEIRLGAGSYLCGEELTLLESLEGRRGHPRIKPPFPAQKGLFGKPTLVNNVETLATIPSIIEKGSGWYKGMGNNGSTGTKIFNISGDVSLPGYYEMEFGVTLRELIFDMAGGIQGGKAFKAALLGGAAGTFVDASMLDVRMDYDTLMEHKATLGSGAIIVLNEDRDIKSFLNNIMGFFKHESCGKCTPCRVGCVRLEQMTKDLMQGDINKIQLVGQMELEAKMMKDTSLCPLGHSPLMPLESAARYFMEELTQ